eukprot:TRINITY_DN10266_c0_g1_i1.p1 TRINITY_DN10266_c0_g1~~TRINITY_DN10266_c0_g1_i1.p1  ORF type:complete len:445 (-),score=64.35 TRINITY_DN10266_c0_g1_i1:232-1566(-)
MSTLECSVDTGDTTWVLISTILVLGMIPALGFFEAGLLRSKNSLSLITQVFYGVVVLSVLWHIVGFSLSFGSSRGGFIGSFEYALYLNVPYDQCGPYAPNIPAALYAMFMMMFASITPLLMTGSFAERIKWKSFLTLTILYEVIVFYPVCHWIWGKGWLADMGVVDFAGGIVIHTAAGSSSLVIALFMGRRKDFDKYGGEFPPSNLPLAALGAALLFMGWFGFNSGSALAAGPIAVSAVVSTQIGGSCSAVMWIALAWFRGKPSCTSILNGVIAGLAGITPASGFINSQSTIILGFIIGLASYLGVYFLKHKLKIDDALDVSSVHGITGVVGSISIGFLAQRSVNPNLREDGLIFGGNGHLLGVQVLAVVVVAAYSMALTYVLLKIIDKTMGVKVDSSEEETGLDLTDHGEYAYHNLWLIGHEPHYEKIIQDDDSILPILRHDH